MRVLVIEDDTTLGHALQEFLFEQGYAVDWLADGDQALGAVAGQSYDLLLLDLNLPGQSGLDVLHKLRAANQQVPVLILTARDGVEDRVAGLDAGADDYVTKPFELSELAARVRAFGRRRARLGPSWTPGLCSLIRSGVRCAFVAYVWLSRCARYQCWTR